MSYFGKKIKYRDYKETTAQVNARAQIWTQEIRLVIINGDNEIITALDGSEVRL
jgi:hypothetical protein